ncbi:MAG: DUF2214 family protein [Gammaproteobacteria bacterium]|nr:DUF2214 family protein [Gammaproteobacteria bacterium]
MLWSALVAFGHFMAFFSLTAALVLQLTLLRASPDIDIARRIQRADRAYGLMAILILVFGLLRVYYFDKGSDYYFNNYYFLTKIALFVGVGLMSIRPTVTYLRWRKEIDQEIAPTFSETDSEKLRRLIHYQLMGIAGIIFCASMMAKGFGFYG